MECFTIIYRLEQVTFDTGPITVNQFTLEALARGTNSTFVGRTAGSIRRGALTEIQIYKYAKRNPG